MSTLTPELKAALVRLATQIVEARGIEELLTWEKGGFACCCMGPQNGDPLCPCHMGLALETHLLAIVNEVDPGAALRLLRRRIVQALR